MMRVERLMDYARILAVCARNLEVRAVGARPPQGDESWAFDGLCQDFDNLCQKFRGFEQRSSGSTTSTKVMRAWHLGQNAPPVDES